MTDRDLAALLADQFAALDDSRPEDPRVRRNADSLDFEFDWPFLPWEVAALERGEIERLRKFRDALLEIVGPALGEVVEFVVGRAVGPLEIELASSCRRAAVRFPLGPETAQREAEIEVLRAWGEQVRRNARAQREIARERRENVQRLRAEAERVRSER